MFSSAQAWGSLWSVLPPVVWEALRGSVWMHCGSWLLVAEVEQGNSGKAWIN